MANNFELNSEFDSYASFLRALKIFENQTLANYSVTSSKKLVRSNKISQEIIDRFIYANIYYKCKFAGEAGGGGTKRKTASYKKDCSAEFVIQFVNANGRQFLRVTQITLNHKNHELTRMNYLALPKQRRESIDRNSMFVDTALKVKPGIKHVQVAINQSEQAKGPVLLKDLYNERRRQQKQSATNENLGDLQSLIHDMAKTPQTAANISEYRSYRDYYG